MMHDAGVEAENEDGMVTMAQALYRDSLFGEASDMPRVGSALENPFVYDSVARDLKRMADSGLVEILDEHVTPTDDGYLIDRIRFRRLR